MLKSTNRRYQRKLGEIEPK